MFRKYKMNHYFNTEVAKQYGVNCAIILENIIFWTKKNYANKSNVHDGYVWIYNSINAWKQLFYYLGESQIKTALNKLEDSGIIKSGNYNDHKYDRTKWYAIIDRSILQNNNIHLAILANGSGENSQPIPDNKPYTKPDNKPANELQEDIPFDKFELIWKRYTLQFLKEKFNRRGGLKKNAKNGFKKLIKKGYRIKDITDLVTEEYKTFAPRDLERVLRVDVIEQFLEDRIA
jgi:hypothetical protein